MSGLAAVRAIGIVFASAGLVFVLLFMMVNADSSAPWGVPVFSLLIGIFLIVAGSMSPTRADTRPDATPYPRSQSQTDSLHEDTPVVPAPSYPDTPSMGEETADTRAAWARKRKPGADPESFEANQF